MRKKQNSILLKPIETEKSIQYLKDTVHKLYGKKGEHVVKMNCDAIDQGMDAIEAITMPNHWGECYEKEIEQVKEPEFVRNIMRVMEAEKGDTLPVSAFHGREDGTFPSGTSAYEKRGIGVNIPEWIVDRCIQCNQCSYICPHACIRPFLLDEEEQEEVPTTFVTKKAVGKSMEGLQYRIQVSPMDCTGCGNCADVCPAKGKALIMEKLNTQLEEVDNWKFAMEKISYKGDKFAGNNVKESQFKTPLMEFSGACAGCGETPYIKLVTQLFGDHMMIANATGCSSIWAASAPSTSYTSNHKGKGPSWANSLFEDNAEYGFGMYFGVKHLREKLSDAMYQLMQIGIEEQLKELFADWMNYKEDASLSSTIGSKIAKVVKDYPTVNDETSSYLNVIRELEDYLEKRTQWIIGGDGWAYDIGYGGLDHVLASGENVNVLIFDTEIYSNTGGQASKSTPTAAIAKFAASGKKTGKKDLGLMMMTYGNVYVAQVGIGADKNQCIKAILEAEAYDGPSIVIAYAPCISHGLREGMGRSMANIDQAVKAGYWHLYRYNPLLKEQGKNPFSLDSKEPTESFRDFLMSQVRYSALLKQYPNEAEDLFERAEIQSKERFKTYMKLVKTL